MRYELLLHQNTFYNHLLIMHLHRHCSHPLMKNLHYMFQLHQHLYIIYHLSLIQLDHKNIHHIRHHSYLQQFLLVLPKFLIHKYHLVELHMFLLHLYIQILLRDDLRNILQVFYYILELIFHNLPLLTLQEHLSSLGN